MDVISKITGAFVKESREILGDNLVGVYLHGSAVMGCFHAKKSDIDLLVVVNDGISDEIKIKYMEMVVRLNADAPEKGIEMSIVKKEVCKPFTYPTPFELHFSAAHLEWYQANPADYVAKMKGTDRDLAAHFTIIYHRGECLYGKEIKEVFGKVSREDYLDSILSDIEDAETEIITNPTYFVLNLCRVLAYKRKGLILSKKEGGEWGLTELPEKYRALISRALEEYTTDEVKEWKERDTGEYARYMLGEISSPDCPQRVYYDGNNILIRDLQQSDAQIITDEEIAQGWQATVDKYEMRLKDQSEGKSISLVAEYGGKIAGYINVYLDSEWGAFANQGYPEIVDFGVLEKYRRNGIGTKLMDIAEQIASEYSDTVYLGVGMHSGYGSAQRMYVKRGYIPDGTGVWYGEKVCEPYADCCNDDDLVLYFSKKLG